MTGSRGAQLVHIVRYGTKIANAKKRNGIVAFAGIGQLLGRIRRK